MLVSSPRAVVVLLTVLAYLNRTFYLHLTPAQIMQDLS